MILGQEAQNILFLESDSAIHAQGRQATRLRDLRNFADADMQTARYIRSAHKLRHEIRWPCIVNIKNDAFAFRSRSVRFASQRYHHKNSRTSPSKPNSDFAPEMVCIP